MMRRALLDRLLRTPGPTLGVEIAARRVTAVLIDPESSPPAVVACATEPLPPGAVNPGLAAPNIADAGAVAGVLTRALDGLGDGGARPALDPAARSRQDHGR
ncbi:MAG TPA: hypothetical protein VNI83_00005 [Vicinamibacterales bacterium]|nr:hypothetical protein [Vicinamibacterales bacterium]